MTEEQWLASLDTRAMAKRLTEDGRERKWMLLAAACWRRYPPELRDHPDSQDIIAVNEAQADGLPLPDLKWIEADLADCFVLHSLDAIGNVLGCSWSEAPGEHQRAAEAQASLIREVFGNPFRPVTVDPAWQTPTVLSLAQAAYEERALPSGELDLARLAVLADALEEECCTDADILTHLRSAGPHVRGCWALDLILGKE